MSIRTLFMGSPDFALPVLSRLADHYNVIGVFTQPDRPAGRGKILTAPPVKLLAEELGIPVYQPEKISSQDALAQLNNLQPDLIVVAAFGQILRQTVLDLPSFGCINVHASLLPRWRGAAPIQAAILSGDEQTGITIMQMEKGVDTGAIISQKAIPIQFTDTAETLSDRLAKLGADLLVETLPGYLDGHIVPVKQNDELSTYAPMLKKDQALLDFSKDVNYLERCVRAYYSWPCAHFWLGQELIKVYRAHASNGGTGSAGARVVIDGYPAVRANGGWLILDEVQPAGKKPMPGDVFLRGARNWATSEN